MVLPPSTKLEGTLGQLNQLTIDRVLLEEPSRSPEFGLDAPQMTLEVTPRQGAPAAIAIGGQNPDGRAYYVRRDGPGGPRDTVLVTRYSVDDLMKVAGELIAEQGRRLALPAARHRIGKGRRSVEAQVESAHQALGPVPVEEHALDLGVALLQV